MPPSLVRTVIAAFATLALVACEEADEPGQGAAPLPPALVPAPAVVTSPDSSRPLAEAPASSGSTASMSPSPYVGHPPRPRTMSAATESPVPVITKPSATPGSAEPLPSERPTPPDSAPRRPAGSP